MKPCIPVILLFTGIFSFSGCRSNSRGKESSSDQSTSAYPKSGSVERLDPAMDKIIASGELPEIIAEGFDWSEGPLWLPEKNILLFSDIPKNSVYQWSEAEGLRLYLKPSGYTGSVERSGELGSNGLLTGRDGRLILCQHGDRRLAVMNTSIDKPLPDFTTLADRWQNKRLNSPNDAVMSSRGDIYFTDPPYGFEKRFDDPKRELDFTGVFRLSATGELTLVTDKMTAPNGVALSPDEKLLYVSNSGGGDKSYWMVFTVNDDGSVGEGKLFYKVPANTIDAGNPDGLKVRTDGTIFASGPAGILVFDPAGRHLGTIRTGQATSNCALDEAGGYLYITADMYVMRISIMKAQ